MNLDQALHTFVAEAGELLVDMEDALLRLETEPDNEELVHAMFRAAHTIKGSAGLFGLDAIVSFTHVVENALDKVRKLVTMRNAKGSDFHLEIDGGIGTDTIADAVRAGVEILVAGNAVFGRGDPAENTRGLLKLAREATLQRV